MKWESTCSLTYPCLHDNTKTNVCGPDIVHILQNWSFLMRRPNIELQVAISVYTSALFSSTSREIGAFCVPAEAGSMSWTSSPSDTIARSWLSLKSVRSSVIFGPVNLRLSGVAHSLLEFRCLPFASIDKVVCQGTKPYCRVDNDRVVHA